MKKITLLSIVVTLTLLLSFTNNTNAQLQNSNWYFGLQSGLNFNDGTQPTTILTDSAMNTEGSSATVSDSSGNLLFYTDGLTVWDNSHQTMTNGNDLFGNGEISQAVMIVPDPNNPDRYYIFTNSGSVMGFSGLYYSVVDMSLNGGLGDIDIAQKNVLVSEDVTKNITAVLNPNDNTYWIIIFGYMNDSLRNDTFSTYKLDQTGINLVNQSTFTFNLNESNNINGSMKVSPDGQSLALIYNTIGNEIEGEFDDAQSLFVFDFDSTTGMISQLDDSILLNDHLYAYGLEFSPDSNLLYVSATNKLSEKSGTVGRIFQVTYRDIGKTSTLIYEGREPIYGIQIGVGDKIYAVNSSGNLGVINSPNIIGTDANYIHGEIDLSPSRAIRELPPLVPQEEITEPPFDICETIKVKNPFKKKLMIQFDIEQIYMVSLFNSSGVLEIFETHDAAIDKKLNINTSSLPSGIYFLNIKTEQLVTCTRTLIRK